MQENVLIRFTSDSEELEQPIRQLKQLSEEEKKLRTESKKAEDQVKKQASTISTSVDQSYKSINKLSNSTQSLIESIAKGGDAGEDFAQRIESAFSDIDKFIESQKSQLKTLEQQYQDLSIEAAAAFNAGNDKEYNSKNAKLSTLKSEISLRKSAITEAAKQSDALMEAEKGYKKNSKSITDMAKQYGNMDKVIANGAAFTSMRTAIKELTQEMALLELQGKQDTEEFRNLRAVAGELTDSMDAVRGRIRDAASDTNTLDGVVAMSESVAAGFSLAQGAAALFGGSSKDLEKALIPLQGAMAVLMGLTSLQNALQKESIQMRVIENIKTRAGAAATKLETAAKSKNIIVSKGATVAQWALNAAMNANPIILLLTGIGLLVAALSLFVMGGESAAEKQEKLNNKMQDGIDISKRLSEHLSGVYSEIDKYLSNQINLYNAQGKSLEEIQRLERTRAEAAVDGSKEQIEANNKLINSLADNEAKINTINDALSRFARGDKRARVSVEVEGKIVNYKIKDEDQKANLEKLRDMYSEQVGMAKEAIANQKDAQNALDVYLLEASKKLNESRMRGTVAYYEAMAIKAKEGTFKEYQAQVSAAKAKASIDLEGVKSSNSSENEKANQILKINAQLHKDLRALRDTYNIEKINRQKNYIDAELALVTEGTRQELDLKLRALEKQKSADLIAAKDNASKRKLIEANYQKEVKTLNEAFQKKLVDDHIAAEEAKANISLLQVTKESNEELKIKKELVDLQADAEANSIAFSEKNEDLRRIKIQAIYAKALEDKRQLERDKANAEIEARLNNQNLDREKSDIEIEKQISKSLFFEWGKRADLENELTNNRLKAIDDEREAFKDKLDKNIISQQEYNSKIKELNNSQYSIELEQIQNIEDAKRSVRETSYELMTTAMSTYFDSKKDRLNQDLEAIQNNYTTDAQEAKTSANKKLVTDEEMKRRELEIKRQIAKADKDQALFNAYINMATGVTKALSSAPPPYNLVLAAITGTASLIQVNSIKNRPLPKYWKGRKGGKGELARVGEYGPEDVFLPTGAAVIPAHQSRTLAEADRIMSQFNIPNRNYSLRTAQTTGQKGNSTTIDYDKLGEAVASRIKNNSVQVSLDRNGYNAYLNEGNTRTKIMNNNYTLNLN